MSPKKSTDTLVGEISDDMIAVELEQALTQQKLEMVDAHEKKIRALEDSVLKFKVYFSLALAGISVQDVASWFK